MKRLFIPVPAMIENSYGTAKQGVGCSWLRDSWARVIEKARKRKKKTGGNWIREPETG